MCRIVGFVNYKQDISNYKNILINMNKTLSRRGSDEYSYYTNKHIALGHNVKRDRVPFYAKKEPVPFSLVSVVKFIMLMNYEKL